MSGRPSTAADLVPGVLRGDALALDRWYRAEHPEAFRLCLGFLADADEAEDAAQDAMLRLHDRLDRFDPARDYATWRTSVVLNLCRDRLRRRAARRRAEDESAVATAGLGLAGEPARPDREAERKELQELLVASLSRLTPREREVFVLRDLAERSSADVAALLDIGESSVRSLLTLARRRVRGYLEPKLVGTDGEGGGAR